MTDAALLPQPDDQARPLYALTLNELADWRAAFPHWARWLDTTGFSGDDKSQAMALLPGADGALAGAVCMVNPDDPWALGGLSQNLPVGNYALQGPWSAAKRAQMARAYGLGAYQFTRYKKARREPAKLWAGVDDVEAIQATVAAIYRGRDLINTPAEDCGPDDLAAAVAAVATAHGATWSTVVDRALLTTGFPAVYTVGRASHRPPQLIEMTWGNPEDPKISLVGKGVCFDTGGLNLKPGTGMRMMKKDMGGAATALALAELILLHRLPVHLQLLIPAVDNALSGNAFRPGDVLTMGNGMTVEIDNTDAEGRLILADALHAASQRQPALLLDFATLTGAARVALGTDLPALFGRSDAWVAALMAAGSQQGDGFWPMPLFAPYESLLKSNIADCVNSESGRYGGAITAALFLQRFVAADVAWLHVDTMAWNLRTSAGRPEGGEVFGALAAFAALQTHFCPN